MKHCVCPWWLGYWLVCPLRLRRQKPAEILSSHVRDGMTVLEPGSGMGFFTLELARLVGTSGRVVAVDIQPKTLDRLKRRAAKAGLLERIDARLVSRDSMGLSDLRESIDFTLAFAVVHELPNVARFFAEVGAVSKSGASLLLAEPKGHVKVSEFDSELKTAAEAGFNLIDLPSIHRSQAALLKKSGSP